MRKKLQELSDSTQNTLNNAISRFIDSNKRYDRDIVIKLKAKMDVYNSLLKDKECK